MTVGWETEKEEQVGQRGWDTSLGGMLAPLSEHSRHTHIVSLYYKLSYTAPPITTMDNCSLGALVWTAGNWIKSGLKIFVGKLVPTIGSLPWLQQVAGSGFIFPIDNSLICGYPYKFLGVSFVLVSSSSRDAPPHQSQFSLPLSSPHLITYVPLPHFLPHSSLSPFTPNIDFIFPSQ